MNRTNASPSQTSTPNAQDPRPIEAARGVPQLGVLALSLAAFGIGVSSVATRAHDGETTPPPVARVTPLPWRVDLSTAGVDELALLPEVGPALAARIVADRARRGPFTSIDALDRVHGIGPHTIAQLRESAWISSP